MSPPAHTTHSIRDWARLVGWLCLAVSWLLASREPDFTRVLTWHTASSPGLSSLCWGIYGWNTVSLVDETLERKAFLFFIWAIVPWFGFFLLMMLPYAPGIRQQIR